MEATDSPNGSVYRIIHRAFLIDALDFFLKISIIDCNDLSIERSILSMKMRKTLSILSAMLLTAGMVSCGKEESSNAVPPVAEITTTGGQTDAAASSTENTDPTDKSSTETQVESTTESSETTTITAAAARLSDQELESYARRYYGVRTNYSPEFVEIRQKDDNTVVIRLFDRADDHEITCEQYTVNPETGEGQDSKGKDVNITNNSLEMWYPEDWAYGISDGIFARILYLGKMNKDDELNQDTLQTLIDSSAGTREYVNHYSYISLSSLRP